MARKKKNKVREGGQKRRTVCHMCGTETTNRPTYQVWSEENGGVIKVCPWCHAKAIRKNAQKNRAVGAAPGRELSM